MNDPKVEGLLRDLADSNPSMAPLFAAVLDKMRAFRRNSAEKVQYGGVVFQNGYLVAGAFCRKAHVTVEFTLKGELPDPRGILEGEGKTRRNIKIASMEDPRFGWLDEYLAFKAADL